MKKRVQGNMAGIRIFLEGSFQNTDMGSILVSVLVSSLVLSGLLQQVVFTSFPVVLCLVIAVPAVFIMCALSLLLFRLIFGSCSWTRLFWFTQVAFLYASLAIVPSQTGVAIDLVCAVIQAGAGCMLGRSLWAFIRNRRVTVFSTVCFLLALVEVIAVSVFFFGPGIVHTSFDSYPELAKDIEPPVQKQMDTEPGPYEVKSVTYGLDKDSVITTQSFNLTAMADQNALEKWNRKNVLGHTLEDVPLQGIIWYPEGGRKCPVLFIVHGNHSFTEKSYLGYEYLGTYLASYGYVVVSVDENMCNMLDNENDARGALLLENIAYLKQNLSDTKPALRTMMDFSNIALAGHSRGGEAITSAWLFNETGVYPENGFVTYNSKLNIKSLIAISPTVDQYEPAGHTVRLKDVNYLLLHGSNDQDVTSLMGQKQYGNCTFTTSGYLKSMVYIAGANHGQFNTRWGCYDIVYPLKDLLNVGCLMAQEDQQTIAKVFIKTFLDVTLKGDDTHRDLLTDCRSYAGSLPETVYQQCHATSERQIIADFEEDCNLKTATLDGATLEACDLGSWYEEKYSYGFSGAGENHLLVLESGKEKEGSYTVTMPPVDVHDKCIVFDVADYGEEQVQDPGLVDFGITVGDDAGNEATFRLRDVAAVYPTLWVQLTKLDYVWRTKDSRHQMQTVTIPGELLKKRNPDLKTQAVTTVRFSFDPDSDTIIILDNLAIQAP